VPYADSVGAIRDLLDEGKIRYAGISNADRVRWPGHTGSARSR
jgi:aryl-alcohol dehydrogenase-like predicted oxidoreductase